MYLRDEITTSCATGSTRYTRLNLLGWAMLCPHALELLVHGSSPHEIWYPTAEEAKDVHEHLRRYIEEEVNNIVKVLRSENIAIVSLEPEYEHRLGIRIGDTLLCANSKADLVYTLSVKEGAEESLVTLYIEVSTRLHVAKPWQALLRGLALYYERRLPVWIVLVSPEKLMYKQLSDEDQEEMVRRVLGKKKISPSPNICSLCELIHFCPYREV